MTRGHDEIQELLGAYALDAVDADEAAEIEDHLRDCPRCRSEVAAHRETAALLVDAHLEPPPDLWDRVAANLVDTAPPPLDFSRYTPRAGRRPMSVSARIVALAAVVALFLGLAGVTLQQNREVDQLQAVLDRQELAVAALTAFDDPQARPATLRSGDGALALRAAVLPDGSGYLLADRLPRLPRERTYQLWGMVNGEAVSAGVLGADPYVIAFEVPEGATALAISEEKAGGADRPTLPARLTGLIDA